MRRKYEKIKAELARTIYRQMYRDNYDTLSSEIDIVSDRINKINQRALSVAVRDEKKGCELRNYCIVTFDSPVRKSDSLLNIKALKLSS